MTERSAIMALRPDWIGNLDGIPAEVRDDANRKRIAGEYDRLHDDRDRILGELSKLKDGVPDLKTMARLAQLERDLGTISASLDSLDNLQDILKKGDRQLLVLDTGGERVKAAVAVGNVDTANHVAVFTPGMNSTVNGRMDGYDNDMRELRDNTLKELGKNDRPNESVATVTWLNYEPPHGEENPLDAAGTGKAEEGAARLASFLNGIDASRADDPHLTALGHSYGSLTTGIALRDYVTGVDEAVVFGSPGLGVDEAGQLRAPQGHAYNLAADGDPVAHVGWISDAVFPGSDGWHGSDPSFMPGMSQLSTDAHVAPDGTPLLASHGHSEYVNADDRYTTSEWNMANIIAGTGNTH